MTVGLTPSILNAARNLARWREAPQIFVREVLGVTPDAWQDEALAAFPKSPRMALKACAGPGKLQPKSMLVDTPSGQRQWGSLQVGDWLFAEDGSPTVIEAVYQNGVVPLYRVTFDDGSSTLAGAEHLWKVRGRTERRHFKTRQSQKWDVRRERLARAQGWPVTRPDGYSVLTTEQLIARNPNGGRRQFELPQQGAVHYSRSSQPLDPYVLGVWLGDGCRQSARGSWRDWEIDDEIKRRGYELRRSPDRKSVTIHGIGDALRQLGVAHLGSPHRLVPQSYKEASIEQRSAVLGGLMDTDGSIGTDNHCEYSTTSKRLALDVIWLARSLGGIACLKPKIKRGRYKNKATGRIVECRDCYRVTVTLPFNPFLVGHKSRRWRRPQARYLTRYIDSIELSHAEDSMCVQVDHPSGCYLANDFIVTHNTSLLAWLGLNFLLTRLHPMVGAASISGDNLRANLWPEIARWRQKSELLQAAFEFTDRALFSREHPKTWRLEARTWAKDANADQIGLALAGLHAKNVMWLLDESGGFPDSIMPIVESIFAGEPEEAHVVQAGNPTQRSGPLYRACHAARTLWRVIEITGDPDDPKRSPRISIEYARQQIQQYGRDNPWVQARILGQFPPSSISGLIREDEVMAATKRSYREHDIAQAGRVLGVDVARFGDDQSVCFPRQGLVAFTPLTWRNIDGNAGAGALARKWQDWDADACFIDDTGGFGSSWIDALVRLNRTAIGIHFAGEPHDRRYFNKRTEMHFDLVQWIRSGGQIPYVPEFVAAITTTTYSFRGDRLLLQPKEQVKELLGYSPDHVDSLALTFAEPVMRASRHRSSPSPRNHSYEYDPYGEVNKPVNPAYHGRD